MSLVIHELGDRRRVSPMCQLGHGRISGRRACSTWHAGCYRLVMVNDGSFNPPHNYCDVQCERCVFEHDCVIAREMRNARWLDDAAADESFFSFDPRGDAGSTDHAVDTLVPARLTALGKSRRARGGKVFVERLRRAGMNYSVSLSHLLHKLTAPFTEVFRDAEIAAALVAPKVVRLTMSLRPSGEARFDSTFADDGYRTLLLLEQVDARTTLALTAMGTECAVFAASFEKARAQLWELLAPLSAQIPVRARTELAHLVVKGRAPSPFFVITN
jgi:hypothetical protein